MAGAVVCSCVGIAAVTYTAVPVDFKVLVNGEEFVSDPPALAVDGRTYMPLRAMGEALGVPVNWNEKLHQAEVGTVPKESSVTVNNEVQTNGTWKMTYKSLKTLKKIDVYTKAEDGKAFVIVSFELENLTDEKQIFSSMFDLDSYFDDLKEKQTVVSYNGEKSLLSTSVEPGKKVKGYLAYQVDTSWKKLEIVYNDDILDKNGEKALKFCILK